MKPFITASCIGTHGRMGNALFQYAFARAYAETNGLELRTPDWWGRQVFENISEPIMDAPAGERTEEPTGPGCDLHGYFQRPHHVAILSRKKLKEWLVPKPQFVQPGYDLVFHKRRGDYIDAGCYAVIGDKSYTAAAIKFGYDPATAKEFSDARMFSEQYEDFFSIMASRAIFRANSSFSWWAATLSNARVYSPVVGDRTGWVECDFVEGNHPKMFYMFDDLHIGE